MPLIYPILFGALVGMCAWLLFRDSMNLFQKLGRVYWITRNNHVRPQPFLSTAFLAHDAPPYYVGKGIQIAWKWGTVHEVVRDADGEHVHTHPMQRSFQVGWITGTDPNFDPNVYFADSKLRQWARPAKPLTVKEIEAMRAGEREDSSIEEDRP